MATVDGVRRVDVDDVRGVALATLHALGMTATFVGVPVLLARRVTAGRPALVVPAAVTVGAVLTVATQRTAWSLVKLWLGIDRRQADQPGQPGQPGQPAGR